MTLLSELHSLATLLGTPGLYWLRPTLINVQQLHDAVASQRFLSELRAGDSGGQLSTVMCIVYCYSQGSSLI